MHSLLVPRYSPIQLRTPEYKFEICDTTTAATLSDVEQHNCIGRAGEKRVELTASWNMLYWPLHVYLYASKQEHDAPPTRVKFWKQT